MPADEEAIRRLYENLALFQYLRDLEDFTFLLIDITFIVVPAVLGLAAFGVFGAQMAGALRNAAQTGTQALKFFGGLAVGAFTGGAAALSSARAAAAASGTGLTFKQGALAFAKGALVGVLDYATPYPISYAFLRQAPIVSPQKPPSTSRRKRTLVTYEDIDDDWVSSKDTKQQVKEDGIMFKESAETNLLVPVTTKAEREKIKRY